MIYPTLPGWIMARINGVGWTLRGWRQAFGRLVDSSTARWQKRIALRRNRQAVFRHDLAVCAIFRDEASYLSEWLTLHHAVGVGHFYLYNDQSSDEFRKVLSPWMQKGLVTLIDWPNSKNQKDAYNDCIRRFRCEARWVGFLDVDEFLFSPESRDLRIVLRDYEEFAAVFVYWCMFGSNGHQKRPHGSVIENYIRCMDLEDARKGTATGCRKTSGGTVFTSGGVPNGKCVVNPRLVADAGVHRPSRLHHGFIADESGRKLGRKVMSDFSSSRLRINHYWSKSCEHLTAKAARHVDFFERNQWYCPNGDLSSLPMRADPALGEWLKIEQSFNSNIDTTLLGLWKTLDVEPCGRGAGRVLQSSAV